MLSLALLFMLQLIDNCQHTRAGGVPVVANPSSHTCTLKQRSQRLLEVLAIQTSLAFVYHALTLSALQEIAHYPRYGKSLRLGVVVPCPPVTSDAALFGLLRLHLTKATCA